MIDIRDYYTSNFPEGREETLRKMINKASEIVPMYDTFYPRTVIDLLEEHFDKVQARTLLREILQALLDLDYISADKGRLKLTEIGRKAKEAGGHIKYLELKQEQSDYEITKRDAELDNLISSTKVNKYLYKTRWWPHFLALIALVISIISLVKECDNKSDKKEIEQSNSVNSQFIPNKNPAP